MTHKKVLVVDNHPVILEFMRKLLTKKDYHVETAQNGLEALKILEDWVPDVIFLDLVMPNISGDKLCQIIRGIPKLKGAHIVILSAVAAEQMMYLTELGADACIAKGRFPEMAKNVLAVIENSESDTPKALPETIMGLDDVNLREITRELLSVKRHLEVIMMSMTEGILELNRDSRVVYANPSSLSLLGIPEEKLLGSRFSDLFAEEVRKEVDKILQQADAPSQEDEQTPILPLNGKEITVNVSPMKDEASKTIVVLNDISKQRRMEAQLQQAQKMEAIGTLAGGIAHDFNNLLMGIQGTVSLLLFRMDPDHPYCEKIRSIEKHVDSGARLTSQLLGYARKGKYEVKLANLNLLVEETSETLGRTKKDITIHRELSDDLWAAEVDEGQIEQVLLNLYVNAAGAMPGGGHLLLKTENTTHEQMHGKLYQPKPGSYVKLTVTDTGSGMDETTKARIFEPFFTTKEMGRGTGLGLASAYGIIKSHGGYIDVDSQKDKGTTFKIFLPAALKTIENVDTGDKVREQVALGRGTILLVDDEQMILEVGQQLLEAMGYDVLTAENGKKAVEIYQAKKNDIDLLILDMIMPEMNGGDVYDTMKAMDPDVKVLLSSGYSVEGQASEILGRGCDGFIQKPFHMGQLSNCIKRVLESSS
jgi:PAS domain S-box-containing protein